MTTNVNATGAVGAAGTVPASGSNRADQRAELAAAAKQFEAIFVRQLIGAMREAKLAEDDLMGSSATESFQNLADARTADALADKGGLGIATMLLQQLDRAQPASQAEHRDSAR